MFLVCWPEKWLCIKVAAQLNWSFVSINEGLHLQYVCSCARICVYAGAPRRTRRAWRARGWRISGRQNHQINIRHITQSPLGVLVYLIVVHTLLALDWTLLCPGKGRPHMSERITSFPAMRLEKSVVFVTSWLSAAGFFTLTHTHSLSLCQQVGIWVTFF